MAEFELYLAIGGASIVLLRNWDWKDKPLKVLIAFPYLAHLNRIPTMVPGKMMLDSGAYSAWYSGAEIDIDALIEETKNPRWDESIALDVIGDGEASLRNALYMKESGSLAYPVFHINDPWEILQEYRQEFPKVGLSCRFGESVPQSLTWLEQCFARAWPFKFHSFGWVGKEMLMRFPFQSADTATWARAPHAWGRWKTFKELPHLRGQQQLALEIRTYLKLEHRIKGRWWKVLEEF